VEIVIIDSRVRGFPGLLPFLVGFLDEVVVVFRAGARADRSGSSLASLAKSPDPSSPGPGAASLSISPVIAFLPRRTEGAAVCYIPQP